MPINVRSFNRVARDADPEARLQLSGVGDDQRVIARGTSLGGRAVAWLQEVFGGPSGVANREATGAFIAAVRREYGDNAGNIVGQQLADRLREGKPLCKRHVEQAMRDATAAAIEMNAKIAAELGDGTHPTQARDLVRELAELGALSPAGEAALLTEGSDDRKQLERLTVA
jgi:hypothetical protein